MRTATSILSSKPDSSSGPAGPDQRDDMEASTGWDGWDF